MKPLLSDEQIEWHSVHDKTTGELMSIETMSPWTCRDLYEADRSKLMAVLQVCADAIGKCPNCDGSGVVVYTCTAHGEPSDIGPCQWCDTYGDTLSQLKAIGVEPNK